MSEAIERPGDAPPRGSTRAPPSRPTSCGSRTDTACSSAGSSSSRRADGGSPRSARRPRRRSPRSPRPTPPMSRARSTRPATPRPRGRASRPSERAKYVFRIARQLQERAREFAVLETMNGGKPIKESRDVDVPLAAAHFFYYAGWADKLEYAFPGRGTPRPVGVAGQIIPWNFPLLMAAWKLAPALATGNTVGAEAGRDHAAHGAAARGGDAGSRAAARRREHRDRRGRDRRRARRGRPSTRSRSPARPRSARRSSARPRAAASASRSSSAARRRTSCSRTRRSTRRSRAWSTASSSTRGTCAAPARACSCRSRSSTCCSTSSRTACRRCASATRSTRTPTSARSTRRRSSTKIEELVAVRRRGGRRDLPARVRPARARVLVPAHVVHRRLAVAPHRARGDLRPGAVDPHLPHRRRGRSRRRTTRRTGCRAGIWTEKGSRILHMAQRLRAGVVWANTFNRFDPTSPFGGYKESGFGREGGLHGLEPYLTFDGGSR